MASTVTLQEILGTDNVSASRTAIIENFRTLANAVNGLSGKLDYSNPGSLNIGSANIDHNLYVGGNVVIEGNIEINGQFAIPGASVLSTVTETIAATNDPLETDGRQFIRVDMQGNTADVQPGTSAGQLIYIQNIATSAGTLVGPLNPTSISLNSGEIAVLLFDGSVWNKIN